MADDKNTAIKVALIGFLGAIIAALITIYPSMRSSSKDVSEQSKPAVSPETSDIDQRSTSVSGTTKIDTPNKNVKELPKVPVNVPPEEKKSYDFDVDVCNTLFSLVSEARYGFRNLILKVDTIKTEPWIETKIRTKVKSLLFETSIGKATAGNTFYMLFQGKNLEDAERTNTLYVGKVKDCLQKEGSQSTNRMGNEFYQYNLNDYCKLEISLIKQNNQCNIILRSLVAGDKPW